MEEGLLEDIDFCALAASSDYKEYTKYGVIISHDMMCAMDRTNVLAVKYLESPIISESILLHLPWCKILQDLGEIKTIACHETGQQNAILFISTKDKFKLVIPTLKVVPNPSILSYLQSLEEHVTLFGLDAKLLKKLEITTDSAYEFITAYSKEGRVLLESSSKVKGKTVFDLCDGDMQEMSATLSLKNLQKVVSIGDHVNIDFDNSVAFVTMDEGNYIYAFSLG